MLLQVWNYSLEPGAHTVGYTTANNDHPSLRIHQQPKIQTVGQRLAAVRLSLLQPSVKQPIFFFSFLNSFIEKIAISKIAFHGPSIFLALLL